MKNSFDSLVMNAINVKKDNLKENTIKITIDNIKKAIDINKDAINEANKIDLDNNNGFKIDFNIFDNIYNNINNESEYYGKVLESKLDKDRNLMYGKQIVDYGTVNVITDGNTYAILEMILRNILAGNSIIVTTNGFMYGSNNLIIEIIREALKKSDIEDSLVQIFVCENIEESLTNYANIDLVIGIGDSVLQNNILKNCKTKAIVSGYENFDLYIESNEHIDFIYNILNTKLNINIYVKEGIYTNLDDVIIVSGVDEAIGHINYSGNNYSAAIFTNNNESASKFISEVKASNVMVNASPTINRILDIKQSDLYRIKTIIYPNFYKFNNKSLKFE